MTRPAILIKTWSEILANHIGARDRYYRPTSRPFWTSLFLSNYSLSRQNEIGKKKGVSVGGCRWGGVGGGRGAS